MILRQPQDQIRESLAITPYIFLYHFPQIGTYSPTLISMKTFALILSLILSFLAFNASAEAKPLKALLVAGGCCHDYKGQHEALFKGIQARANVQVDVYWTDDKSVNPPLALYENPDWAKGYDIIIHDECAAGNKDLRVMKNILKAHETIPAVHLHCAMHSFRNGTDQWFKHLGIQSSRHGPQQPIKIEFVAKDHPITKTLKDWTTINEELYNNVDVFDAQAIAMGKQMVKGKEEAAIVAWTNEKQGAPSFSTTIGHNTSTVADERYLEMVTRGLLWASGKLNEDYLGKPFTGENKITFVKAAEQKKKPAPKANLGAAPKGATLVTMTAQSEETGKSNFAWKAVDGTTDSRWCASGGSKPQWLQLELDAAKKVSGVDIIWENANNAYGYKLEGSADGKKWEMLADETGNKKQGDTKSTFGEKEIRFLKITCTSSSAGGWASIREVSLKSSGIKSLFPKLDEKTQAAVKKEREKAEAAANDPHAKEGNIAPKIVKLSAEEEATILKNASVPEGFDMTLFSNSEAANYPVYVAASPNGDLYVSSDGNGSLGRDPHRGRVLRLRDKDGDGRADEVTEFVKDIDSPRGLIWDHDRLYLLHPPHISVFHDKDGDGVSEDSQILIKDIAFGFADRPADHTTNDITLGVDGWIYIAGGDFGFLKATGTDGRELQHRGGGVIRFRPDGSGLEIFATGTRNILATPISPTLEMFARDNTNDGGGWDVRFHHFTGLEDHGYPRMYKNFGEEHIAPLADYGGGSGCGGVYISEPGFPAEWNNAPFTCDWGTGALWRHTVEKNGATYVEPTAPEKFVSMTRPTDASVDGMSGVYQASWIGATFKWAGPDVGYIVRVTPKGYEPDALPDFEKMSDAELVAALESNSQVRTLEAQRTLLRRDAKTETTDSLVALAGNNEKPLAARVAALFAITQSDSENIPSTVAPLADDAELKRFVARALADVPGNEKSEAVFADALRSSNARTQLEAIVAVARQNIVDLAPNVAVHLGSDDPVVAHTAFRGLAQLKGADAAFAVLDDTSASANQRVGAAYALMRIHDTAVVDGVIRRLEKETRPDVRKLLISILSRLHFADGEWKGDSWGTRPDTRGPYYQPEAWSETPNVAAVLQILLERAPADEAAFLVKEMARNRIQSDGALKRILSLAKENPKVIPEAVAQLATTSTIPADGVDILLTAIASKETAALTRSQAVVALAKTDSAEGAMRTLVALTELTENVGAMEEAAKAVNSIEDEHKKKSEGKLAKTNLGTAKKQLDTARDAFLKSPKLENHHTAIEKFAEDSDSPEAFWADAALIALAGRKGGSPESREMSQKALDAGFENPKRRIRLFQAVAALKNRSYDNLILAAMSNADPEVAATAKQTAKVLKLKPAKKDDSPKIGTLTPEKAIAMAVKMKGDANHGEQLFAKATCIACHTATQDEPQKGPYLGNIAQTYKRPDLAVAIIEPNKTIAQGFATNVIAKNDGTMVMGFVTDEAGDSVTVRDIAAQEHKFKKSDIKKRDTIPTSMMPPGLMNNFTVKDLASLLEYLEKLSKK